MFRDYGERFLTDHKKRNHLFRVFKGRFEATGVIHRYWLGLINRHLTAHCSSLRSCSTSEVAALGELGWEGLGMLANRPRWVAFFGVSLFNHHLERRAHAHANPGGSGLGEAFAISKKSDEQWQTLTVDFAQLAQSYFRDFMGLELTSSTRPQADKLLAKIHAVLDQLLSASAAGDYFDTGRTLKAVYLLYCLVRGVKNKAGLLFLKRFLLEELSSRRQATAFMRVLELLLRDFI